LSGNLVKGKNTVIVEPLNYSACNNSTRFQDARSAAFYALGLALKEKEPVFLLVPGNFAASTFTAVTEAWLQKANVIVIAFYDKVSDVKTVWMDRCVLNTLTAGENEHELIESFIRNNSAAHGPVLLNIVCQTAEPPKTDYSEALKYLGEKTVITFNSAERTAGINDIAYRYKYGLISKYIGMSAVKDCGVLLCTADAVLVDVNVFRTRYANANMKIVIIDDGSILASGIEHWISSNGWSCKVSETYEDIAWLNAQEKQSVLVVKGA